MEHARAGWSSRIPLSGDPKVSFVVSAYQRPRQILVTISSLLCQTHRNIEIVVVHDGPDGADEVRRSIERINNGLVRFEVLPSRRECYGNPCKAYGTEIATGTYIGHSNDDNYYAPVYVEWMVGEMIAAEAGFAYCDMVHSHIRWAQMNCEPSPGKIDGGGWICRSDVVRSCAPIGNDGYADGKYAAALAERAGKCVHVPALLFVHN